MNKRFISLAAIALLLPAALFAAFAAPAQAQICESTCLTLNVAPTTVPLNVTMTASGQLSGVADTQTIYLGIWTGTCAGGGVFAGDPSTTTDQNGNYSLSGLPSNFGGLNLVPGHYFMQAYYEGQGSAQSDCVDFTVVAAVAKTPPPPDSVFLCYSHFGTDTLPAVFTNVIARKLYGDGKQGYFYPVAEAGAVAGGNNVGKAPTQFHIVCNPPSTLTAQQMWADDGNDVYGPVIMTAYQAYWGNLIGLYQLYS